MDVREFFNLLIADFSKESGIAVSPDENGNAVVGIGDIIVNLQLLPQSKRILAWSTIGFLGNDANADMRMLYLMRLNDNQSATYGFSFSCDPDDEGRILVHDSRPFDFFDSADRLAAWIEALCDLVADVRMKLEIDYPIIENDDLEYFSMKEV